MKSILILIILLPFGVSAQKPGFEFHCSVNHPLSSKEDRTFYGVGIGANILLRDTCLFNFKTGIEVNYFHTWDEGIYSGKMSSKKDLHYRYAVVSIPAFVRLTFGDRFKVFLEAGAYAGVCVAGKVRYTYTSYSSSPNDPTTTQESKDSYNNGLSISPAIGLGTRFPLLVRLDVFLKAEFALVIKGQQLSGNTIGSGYGGDYDFNYRYKYLRLCAGIHLK
ncbi:MAG: hypothetical protein K0S23_2143 [Fluviicola sp.]|jgi:hypothetical protein|uniref:outer membrane beta-barrel protein n=1 Tax=Fluviicola sp. TaxID=1917219 RepID=UPI002627617A|nr:outer membrane beta-barrel protein [Fluviicola sp.]MDF3027836.1 hypothetical protein [Fluviicola sp.]